MFKTDTFPITGTKEEREELWRKPSPTKFTFPLGFGDNDGSPVVIYKGWKYDMANLLITNVEGTKIKTLELYSNSL